MPSKIKILAPSRNLLMTQKQIEAGADEVYFGVESGDFKVYSFSGRYKSMNGVKVQIASYEELKENLDICHENGVSCQLAANMHYIPEELNGEYLEHIKACVSLGVDQLIVSNISLIAEIRKSGIDTPILAGSFTFMPNSEMVKYLESIGVFRVVLPHAMRLNEIAGIKAACPNVELEIFALIGGGNNCGRCLMFHSPVRKDIGPGCRALYDVNYGGVEYTGKRFLDAAADCALCSMKDLIDAGADALKIVGRESKNEAISAKFTNIFVRFREGVYAGKSTAEIKKDLAADTLFWNMNWLPRFCEDNRCKFHKTEVTESYI
ncbi:MAG: U32 family peptidase [Clostridiales bacterium]|jgi:putative protease|nr:U32 family peptidase [Clostridiales bacterium]MDR2749285.1 U32 family peptidase [Clostridiales bacterium]